MSSAKLSSAVKPPKITAVGTSGMSLGATRTPSTSITSLGPANDSVAGRLDDAVEETWPLDSLLLKAPGLLVEELDDAISLKGLGGREGSTALEFREVKEASVCSESEELLTGVSVMLSSEVSAVSSLLLGIEFWRLFCNKLRSSRTNLKF